MAESIRLQDPQRVTHGFTNHEHPAFSPDGKRLAFYAGDYGYIQLHVIGLDGKGQRPLTCARGNHTQAHWSPDGAWVYYRRQAGPDKPWEIWRVSVENPGQKQCLLADGKASYKHPSVSPDGKRLAWFSDVGSPGNFHLWLAPLQPRSGKLGRLRQLTGDANRNDCHPTWSPDGKWLTFHAYMGREDAGTSHIYVIDASGKQMRRVSDVDAFHKHPFFVGTSLIVHHTEPPDGMRYLALRNFSDGKLVARLTSGKKNDKHPTPHVPDRGPTRIAFSSKKRGDEEPGEAHTYDVFVATLSGVAVRRARL
jgi:Tol biopolymer transport system component